MTLVYSDTGVHMKCFRHKKTALHVVLTCKGKGLDPVFTKHHHTQWCSLNTITHSGAHRTPSHTVVLTEYHHTQWCSPNTITHSGAHSTPSHTVVLTQHHHTVVLTQHHHTQWCSPNTITQQWCSPNTITHSGAHQTPSHNSGAHQNFWSYPTTLTVPPMH